MKWKKILGVSMFYTSVIILSIFYVDVPLSKLVTEKVGLDFLLSSTVSNMPDILLMLVCTVTLVSWALRVYLARITEESCAPAFFEFIGCSAPLAFIFKFVLKDLFGRTNTRFWLMYPDQLGFHWFHGGGNFESFPSGHMAVFTALLLPAGRYFPRLRPLCAGMLILISLALIVTQYHFLGDIAAGFYLGLVVDWLTWLGLSIWHNRRGRETLDGVRPSRL